MVQGTINTILLKTIVKSKNYKTIKQKKKL